MPRSQRNTLLFLAIATFAIVSILLYSSLDASRTSELGVRTRQSVEVENLKKVVHDLNDQLKNNRDAMERIRSNLAKEEEQMKNKKNLVHENAVYDEKEEAVKDQQKKLENYKGKPDDKADFEVREDPAKHGGKIAVVHQALHKSTTLAMSASSNVCSMRTNFSHTKSDVQMLDVYKTLKFDNPDGGVWKQGWEVTYEESKVSSEPTLQVIVIPHSHCDPGWIKTFDQYYQDQVSQILGGMAKHLGEKPDMRFIYAEMSFFERWWREQTEETRKAVKGYLESGVFEIVTGGWVMADEANSHYFAIIAELFEGHEWLKNHLNYRPKAHWSIDPFGLSPSLPLLLSASNITNAAMQRIHYSIKKHLAKNKQLEFAWRQMWGAQGQKDVHAHVFPFYSYDIPHTCGPEPAVCCQFDFKRLPGSGDSCPWNIPPQEINDGNVASRAQKLYDQYRKKSQLYGTNALLIPLGDDFRYAGDFEWNAQHNNYKKLFEYMNAKKEWNVKAKFGTLSDYFKLMEKELSNLNKELPVLTGDFFTYADRDDHYWSGYFTSRPFYKQMDRVLQHYLRSAETVYTMALMEGFKNYAIYSSLVSARRHLSLFQHHDGVTGTAKDPVVVDYGSKMLSALDHCDSVLAASLEHLLDSNKLELSNFEHRPEQDILPTKRVFSAGSTVVVFNTLSRPRSDPICVLVNSATTGIKGDDVKQQISPVFEYKTDNILIAEGKYELCFIKTIGAFASETFELTDGLTIPKVAVSSNDNFNAAGFEVSTLKDTIDLDNGKIKATFSTQSGFLKTVAPKGKAATEINLQFISYGARGHRTLGNGGGDDLSGAYLFLPDGAAKPLQVSGHSVVVLDGPVVKHVVLAGHKEIRAMQTYTLYENSDDIEIETEIDISQKTSNFELAMVMRTSVKSGDDLYTDLNGMQMIRRVRMLDKLPLQAHYYPMPGSAFIEDSNVRVNMLGAQALGVASLREGEIEIMLDRRLNQDDGRGLFQGVLDNHRTVSRFRLLVEPQSGPMPLTEDRVGFLSTVAHASSLELHYPWVRMNTKGSVAAKSAPGLGANLPCDLHVVNLRTLAKPTDYENNPGTSAPLNSAAFILHRTLPDCRNELKLVNKCHEASHTISAQSIFPKITKASGGTLTMMYEETEALNSFTVEPQQVRSIKLQW